MNEPLRVIIVDDEENAISIIKLLLEPLSEIEIVASCSNGYEAIEAISSHKPDLVFLDIQMPEVDGFQVIEKVKYIHQPYYIFTTAYDEYAVKAFDVHALDYLLKPFDDDRFFIALNRAKEHIDTKGLQHISDRIDHFLNDRKYPKPVQKLSIKTGGKTIFIETSTIDWIEADNQYAKVHTKSKSYLIRESLNSLEQRLSDSDFYRSHRSAIINIHQIQAIEPYFKGDFIIHLNGGTKVKLSRSRKHDLKSILNWS